MLRLLHMQKQCKRDASKRLRAQIEDVDMQEKSAKKNKMTEQKTDNDQNPNLAIENVYKSWKKRLEAFAFLAAMLLILSISSMQ